MSQNEEKTDSLAESGLLVSRNSEAQLQWYKQLEQFFNEDEVSTLLKLWSFSLYVPRQTVTDYLVRYELFKMILDVPGSVVELGTFNGQGLMSFAQFSAIHEPNHVQRVFYGFDTFTGVPGISEKDMSAGTAENIRPEGFNADSYLRIKRAIELFDANRFIGHRPKVHLVQGDICETVPTFLEQNPHLMIALLYLDIDLYNPTVKALKTFLPRVPKGGLVVFDELNTPAYPGETLALMDTIGIGNVALKKLPFCSRISYFIR